jgi:type III pantothenate kinase
MSGVLLAIDVGNTHTVIGVYEGDRLVRHWRVLSDPGRTADEYGVLFWNLYHASELPIPKESDIIVCSVVPR